MVTNEPVQERRIQRQFDSFCKTVLRNAVRDIYREISRQNKNLIVLSALTQNKLNQLSMYDNYVTDVYHFYFHGRTIKVKDFLISNAIQSLQQSNQLIILFFFFLDMSDTEIANELEIARGTVYYQKQKVLERIKNYLKEHADE
ncbi:sigma-70 family RNA polymerase sigma factor [Oceanobacillus sp. J11TS1]|uniref:sigma-70 family RNA polymerase sigma factor n=1 Tax=Oceanobacillus sp. J11TS1 TaxID=2807191 RepID=UPI001B2F17C1|nr:sigma-70 family RNA polymerase sigma factor [Oceanobacillus sp. J11TS1]GIO22990.1 DNA-directed RNA polymerase sigma-70 factor [Oceanobacillus sp. J11TS1]